MRTIGVVTAGRSDYFIYLPILRMLQADPDLELRLMVTGMHLSPEFGMTVNMIGESGFTVGDTVEMLLSSDSPEGVSKAVGLGVIGFAQCLSRNRPDILLVLGDRFEMAAAVIAALPLKVPVAHIHGGELTQGAIDDSLRHCITKMSHLHFVSTQEYRGRVIQLGEEPWRVTVSGAPGLDNVNALDLPSVEELEEKLGVDLSVAPLLVTYHPVTLEFERTAWQVSELLAALEAMSLPVIFTAANADTSGRTINAMISNYVAGRSSTRFIPNMGTGAYFSMMRAAAAMVGNSSSGIIEAASFGLPVVNVGTRQLGRVRGANVVDTDYGREEIVEAIRIVTATSFRHGLEGMVNPYGDGRASERITDRLKEVVIDDRLLMKRFFDLESFRSTADCSGSTA